MTRIIRSTAVRLRRRRFIGRLATLTFGVFAGLAAGVPEVA